MVVSHENQGLLLPLAGGCYGLAVHPWVHRSENREARPDIFMAIDQTIVDRLFLVT